MFHPQFLIFTLYLAWLSNFLVTLPLYSVFSPTHALSTSYGLMLPQPSHFLPILFASFTLHFGFWTLFSLFSGSCLYPNTILNDNNTLLKITLAKDISVYICYFNITHLTLYFTSLKSFRFHPNLPLCSSRSYIFFVRCHVGTHRDVKLTVALPRIFALKSKQTLQRF